MKANDPNTPMVRHAYAAAEMILAESGHKLDFSEPTIGAVEAILNGFWQESDNSDELIAKIALLFGSYIGEVIRKCYPQATWTSGSLTPDALSPALVVGDITLYPLSWCYKRLYNGPSDSVVDKYMAFRQALVG
jgi:hypothetical protein